MLMTSRLEGSNAYDKANQSARLSRRSRSTGHVDIHFDYAHSDEGVHQVSLAGAPVFKEYFPTPGRADTRAPFDITLDVRPLSILQTPNIRLVPITNPGVKRSAPTFNSQRRCILGVRRNTTISSLPDSAI